MASPCRKLEITKDIKCEAHKFYEMCKHTPHQLTEVFHESYKSCEIVEGDGGVGTIKRWKYVLPGKTEVLSCLEKVEVLDDEKMLIVLDLYEGHHIADYPLFKVIIQVTPKGTEGCSVKCATEFEKGHDGATDPHHYMDMFDKFVSKLDGHIVAKA